MIPAAALAYALSSQDHRDALNRRLRRAARKSAQLAELERSRRR